MAFPKPGFYWEALAVVALLGAAVYIGMAVHYALTDVDFVSSIMRAGLKLDPTVFTKSVKALRGPKNPEEKAEYAVSFGALGTLTVGGAVFALVMLLPLLA